MLTERSEDVRRFWSGLLAERGTGDPEVRVTPSDFGLDAMEAFDVTFVGSRGDPIDATFVRPRGSANMPCIIRFGGYGEGRGHPLQAVQWPSLGFAELAVDTRGHKLAPYDGVNLAPLATCAALFSLSLADEVCSPSSTLSAFRAYGGPKRLNKWLYDAHGEVSLAQTPTELDFLREVLDLDASVSPNRSEAHRA